MKPQPMKPTIKIGDRIELEWLDSVFVEGWRYPHHPQNRMLPKIKSIGFVTSVSESHIEISSSIGETGGVLSPLMIPRGSVLKMGPIGGGK